MIDEDPSEEDIARFDHDTAFCPDCGAEVWDSAEICPKCFAYLDGKTSSSHPVQQWFNKQGFVLVIIALLVAAVLIWLWSMPAGY